MDSLFNAPNFAGEPSDDKENWGKLNLNVGRIIKCIRKNGTTVDEKQFTKKLMENYFANSGFSSEYMPSITPFYISEETVDSIVESAKKWRRYLQNSADFEGLLISQLTSMLCCHVAVFSVYFCEKYGFKMVEERPDPSYAIIIDRDGNVKEMR